MIEVEYRGTRYTLNEKRIKVIEILRKLEIIPEHVLVVKNGDVVTEDEFVEEGDSVEIISAISGGCE